MGIKKKKKIWADKAKRLDPYPAQASADVYRSGSGPMSFIIEKMKMRVDKSAYLLGGKHTIYNIEYIYIFVYLDGGGYSFTNIYISSRYYV